MNRLVSVPAPDQVIATIRNSDDLVEAFRSIKAILGMTNAQCDGIGGMIDGHTDKMLGPSQQKGIGPHSFSVFCWLFAVQFEMKIDIEQAKTMMEHWETRTRPAEFSENGRVSKKMLEKAKPLVFKEAGRAGGLARVSKQSPSLRSELARKAGQARMQKVTKEQRSAMNKKGWETRRKAVTKISIDASR